MNERIQEFKRKQHDVKPDGSVEPGINGVMHGPYPRTDNHPYDTAAGNSKAIRQAFHTERIDEWQANDLQEGVTEVERLRDPNYVAFVREMGPAVIGGLTIGIEYAEAPAETIEVHRD